MQGSCSRRTVRRLIEIVYGTDDGLRWHQTDFPARAYVTWDINKTHACPSFVQQGPHPDNQRTKLIDYADQPTQEPVELPAPLAPGSLGRFAGIPGSRPASGGPSTTAGSRTNNVRSGRSSLAY